MNRKKEYTVGQLIRFYREREGLSQDELAEIIHVTNGKLAHWENDETIPRPSMVARLIGALRIPDTEAPLLMNAVNAAENVKAHEEAELQAITAEQNAENERLQHKRKAIKFSLMGLLGFAIGFIFVFIADSNRDFPWYAPFVIGLFMAGIPYGWDLIRDKSGYRTETHYYGPDGLLIQFMVGLIGFALKLFASLMLGFFVFPIALLYHAYKAGRKDSLYKKLMFAIMVLVVLFIGVLVLTIARASFSK